MVWKMKRQLTEYRKFCLGRAKTIPNKSVEYNTIAERFSPLDLIFFKGDSTFSKIIGYLQTELLGNGDFSHVGILVNSEILPTISELKPGRWYVWESTFYTGGKNDIADITTGQGKFGVQIRDLELVCKHYQKNEDCKVAWAQLINNPWKDTSNREELAKKVSSIHKLYGNRGYNVNVISLIASIFPCLRRARDNFHEFLIDGLSVLSSENEQEGFSGWLYCSQLVALIYQRLGLIAPEIDPNNVVPVDFLGYDIDGLYAVVNNPIYIAK